MRMLVAALAGLCFVVEAKAEDTIWLSAAGNVQSTIEYSGEIVDFNGTRIVLKFSNGRETDYPAERVQRYRTHLTSEHSQANQLFAQKQYAAAIDQYSKAERGSEQRPWVRREILAQRARCWNFRGHASQAADDFLAIYASDPQHRHWDCIPLLWRNQEVNVLEQRKFAAWIDDARNEAKQLIAASHLLGINKHSEQAKRVLQALARADEAKIAWYAQAQLWRLELTTAPVSRVREWEVQTEKQPTCCQAGAWVLIGRAWSLQRNQSSAALAWLRVPLVFAENRALAADALLSAAQATEGLGQIEDARTLYEEVTRDYGDFQVQATAAQRRLAELR